jgi:hypothetical protein
MEEHKTEIRMIKKDGVLQELVIPPEESCEYCRYYHFRFIHGCDVTGKFQGCPPEVKCPRFVKRG